MTVELTPLELLAIQETPAIIDALRALFTKANPGAPLPTSDELVAAWHTALASSLAKDDAWRAAHPNG